MILLTLLLSVTVTMVTAGYYDGHQVLRVLPKQRSDAHAVVALGEELGVDFWHYPHSVNDSFHVRVSPQLFRPFMTEVRSLGLEVTVLMKNVQEHVDREMAELRRKRSTTSGSRSIGFNEYYQLSDIENYVDGLTTTGSVAVSTVGLQPATEEGRNLRLVKIWRNGNEAEQSIFLDCGIHAREWISPAFCLYLIEQLMKDSDPQMLDMYTWYVIPVANPDGYAFSHRGERLWRKNRRRNTGICYGVDLNRNFGLGFGGEGTSNQACSDIYRGMAAFSEKESTAMKDAMESLPGKIAAYLNVHAYSQLWMTPWGYTHEAPTDIAQLKCVGGKATQAISELYGTQYQIGSPGELLYLASGGAFDWAKGELNVKYSYALELRDEGQYGFILPESQIQPTVEETWAGVRAMASAIYYGDCDV